MRQKLHVKNMVCPRCITSVESTLRELNIGFDKVELGLVTTTDIDKSLKFKLGESLKEKGFELLEDQTSALISQIKSLIIDQIHYSTEALKVNFSTYLSENLNHEYTYLSRLFSSVESITIEKFITSQKIERVKELLVYDEHTLSQIAFQMNYSSVAHLSAQFKKETGLTPSSFKQIQEPNRRSLDQI